MKKYNQDNRLQGVVCNQCGKELRVESGILMEGILEVKQNFGFFSGKDGETHSFDLCEACYDKWIEGFAVPVQKTEEFEWQANHS